MILTSLMDDYCPRRGLVGEHGLSFLVEAGGRRILFDAGQDGAFMVGLAFAVAASANFPALLLSIMWKGFTTAGAVASIVTGTVLAVGLIVISPTVWVDLLKHPQAIFALKNPAIISMTAAFAVGVLVSLLRREPAAAAQYESEKLRTYLGVGAE